MLEQQLYETVVGEPVTVTPRYENCGEETVYLWTCDGETLSTGPVLTFESGEPGEYWILLTACNSAGEDKAEIRIDVYGQTPPVISLPGAIGGFSVLQDSMLVLAPEISSALPVTCSWTVDGEEVSTDSVYIFPTGETGTFEGRLRVENRDGADNIEFTVEVLSPGEAFSWTFDRTEYGICSGRSLMLRPLDIEHPFDAVYTWAVDGSEVQSGQAPEYVFDLTAEGSHTVNVTMRNSYTTVSQDLTVTVLPAEGTYFRPADGSSSPLISRVYEYTPAPGQFINEGCTATTMQQACDYAYGRLSEGAFVSLGAFGGYIIVGFDHSVESGGESALDLQITGNAHSSSSEPGIIWVSQDENGNGLPDDTWYTATACPTTPGTSCAAPNTASRRRGRTMRSPTTAPQSQVRTSNGQTTGAGTVQWIISRPTIIRTPTSPHGLPPAATLCAAPALKTVLKTRTATVRCG